MKFTVGKKSKFGTLHGNTIYDSEGDSVAMVYGLFQNTSLEELQKFPHCEKELKRAYVLAAAPELLEALEDLKAWSEVHTGLHYTPLDEKVQAAIRKARGEDV